MKKITAISLALMLTACASTPESDPSYVPMSMYQDYNCKQISAEMQRVNQKIEVAMKTDATQQAMNTALAAFAISQGYGYGGGGNAELQRLKNQIDVLEQTKIKKECGLK